MSINPYLAFILLGLAFVLTCRYLVFNDGSRHIKELWLFAKNLALRLAGKKPVENLSQAEPSRNRLTAEERGFLKSFEIGGKLAKDPKFKELFKNLDGRGHHIWRHREDPDGFLTSYAMIRATPVELERLWDAVQSGIPLSEPIKLDLGLDTTCGDCGDWPDVETDGVTARMATVCPCPPEGPIEIEINVPSGEMVFNDDLRPIFDIQGNFNVNCRYGIIQQILAYAKIGCAHGFVGNSCPRVYRDLDGKMVVANVYDKEDFDEEDEDEEVEEDGENSENDDDDGEVVAEDDDDINLEEDENDESTEAETEVAEEIEETDDEEMEATSPVDSVEDVEEPEEPIFVDIDGFGTMEKIGGICTDLWWYSFADADEYKRRGGDKNPRPGVDTVKVRPGVYKFTYFMPKRDDNARVIVYAKIEWIREPDLVQDFEAEYMARDFTAGQVIRHFMNRWPREELSQEDAIMCAADHIFCTIGGGGDWHANGFIQYDPDMPEDVPDMEIPVFDKPFPWYPMCQFSNLVRASGYGTDIGDRHEDRQPIYLNPSFVALARNVARCIIVHGVGGGYGDGDEEEDEASETEWSRHKKQDEMRDYAIKAWNRLAMMYPP